MHSFRLTAAIEPEKTLFLNPKTGFEVARLRQGLALSVSSCGLERATKEWEILFSSKKPFVGSSRPEKFVPERAVDPRIPQIMRSTRIARARLRRLRLLGSLTEKKIVANPGNDRTELHLSVA